MVNSQMTSGGILAAASNPTAAAAPGTVAAAARGAAMERPGTQEVLRCPRCDSSNTKFCYYNNYSLSQPRHFCKACKRYWTRGGTLRNVPVGGGCRKNKRLKKPSTASSSSSTSSTTEPSSAMPSLPFLPNNPTAMAAPGASSELSLLLYSLANPVSEVSRLALPGLIRPQLDERISMPCTPYDLQPQLHAFGHSFPSNTDEGYLLGLKAHLTQTAPGAATTSAPSPLHDCSLFGSNAASLLASSIKQQQHKPIHNANLLPYAGVHTPAASGNMSVLKEVKIEGEANGEMMSSNGRNMFDWQFMQSEHALEAIAAESSLYWNAATAPAFGGGVVWPDAASCGPSMAPLI